MIKELYRGLTDTVGDAVWVHIFSQGPCWLAGEVVRHKGQCVLIIKLTDNRIVHWHLDHVRQRFGNTTPDVETPITGGDDPLMAPTSPNIPQEPTREQEQLSPPLPSVHHPGILLELGNLLTASHLCKLRPLLRREYKWKYK